MVQLAPPASGAGVVGQSPVTGATSANPEVAAVVSVTVAAPVACWPVLVSTKACVTAAPTSTLPKPVEDPAAGARARPAAVCPVALAVKVTEPPGVAASVSIPLRAPAAVALNETAMVQLAPGAIAAVQVFAPTSTSPGSPLVSAGTPVGTSPPLVTVQGTLPLVAPTTTVPKLLLLVTRSAAPGAGRCRTATGWERSRRCWRSRPASPSAAPRPAR